MTVAERPAATDADVEALWRRLCDEVIQEEVNKRVEELRAGN